MQCVPGITAPIGFIDGGAQVQCASNDGASCLWGSCPTVTTGSKPLAMPCPGWMGTNGIAACELLEQAKKDDILPFMNDTDLSGGDYNSTHLPAGTDPHQCAALCMHDPNCMVWVYVIRGEPLGSGDCIFKSEKHSCPIPSPHSTSQGVCTSGRGHEPIGHKCKPSGPPPARSGVMQPVRILKGEMLDVSTHTICDAGGFLDPSDRPLVMTGPDLCRSSGGRDLYQWRPRGVHTCGG